MVITITTTTNDVTGVIQSLPQFDETATIIVAPALATAHNKRLNIRRANLTDFPHTIKNHTKLAELLIFKPEDTKHIRPIDAAAFKLLQDPDDTHMYVNELMKPSENEQNDENLWFPTPENPSNLFRNNMKMYPHFTVIQKITFFHSLLRGDALQAICNIEDSKKTHWTKR